MFPGDLARLLGQAVDPQVGRRFPTVSNAPRIDPLDRPYLRPAIDTQNGPQWQWGT